MFLLFKKAIINPRTLSALQCLLVLCMSRDHEYTWLPKSGRREREKEEDKIKIAQAQYFRTKTLGHWYFCLSHDTPNWSTVWRTLCLPQSTTKIWVSPIQVLRSHRQNFECLFAVTHHTPVAIPRQSFRSGSKIVLPCSRLGIHLLHLLPLSIW